MSRRTQMTHRFVEEIPRELEEGVLYVSIHFATAVHRCCCGCGQEVVTPLSPTDWQLVFDGKAISLYPSVGSWNLPCQSHYWIRRDMVEWAPRWSRQRIEAERSRDRVAKADYYGGPGYPGRAEDTVNAKPSLWDKLMRGKKKGRS